MQINAYLNFNGNCAEAFDFYERCFGGQDRNDDDAQGCAAGNADVARMA